MISRVLVALVVLVAVSNALDSNYLPSSAISDLNCKGGLNTHALWLPGVSTNLNFLAEPEEPSLSYDSDAGTARLTGRVQDGDIIFDVDVTFSGFVGPEETAPSGSPKLELQNQCYAGDVDPDTWSYFTGIDGYLTAVPGSLYEGGIIAIGRHGPAMQIGIGANGKNTEFGFSAWLSRSVEQQPSNGNTISFSGSHGDFNINLAVTPGHPDCGCGYVIETLLAGQTIPTGTVSWNYDGEFHFVAEATNGWIMKTIHLHVSADEPPTNGAGNPQNGHFSHPFENVNTDFFTVSIAPPDVPCGELAYVAFHAEMALIGEDGSEIQTETGFAEGPNEFEGNRWGWYSTYQTCCDYDDCNFEGCRLDSDCDNGGNVCVSTVCNAGYCELNNNDEHQVATACGVGACASTGVQTCVNQELVDSCEEGTPSEETCNLIDDNCDGEVDNGIDAVATTCGSDGCSSEGELRCLAGAMVDSCNPNDTDGDVVAETECGVGACRSTGQIVCSGGEPQPDTCEEGTPSEETCNGVDDNCDGEIDDGIESSATVCGFGDCSSQGILSCQGVAGMQDSCDINSTDLQDCNSDLCMLGEFCTAGLCGSGAPKNCDDQNECTVDTCDSAHGYCEHAALESDECSGTIPIDVEINCAANTTTICYEVFTNDSPALSHWGLCIPENVQVTGTGPAECPVITGVGVDGSIDFDGHMVKFDCSGEPDSQPWSGTFCLTFQGVYDVSEDGLAVVKRARLQEYTNTIGIADCGDDAQQSDICDTSVTVEIDLSARKMARDVACTTQELRVQLAELASVSAFSTTVYEHSGDHVTVTFVNSASSSGAEAAATLIDALNGGARPACLHNVEAVAVVDIPEYSSYVFDGFSGAASDSGDESNSGASNSGGRNSNSGSNSNSSSQSDAASLGASLVLLFAALAALLC